MSEPDPSGPEGTDNSPRRGGGGDAAESSDFREQTRVAQEQLGEVVRAYRALKAENESYQERVRKNTERRYEQRHERLLLKFIDILDNLDRALEAAELSYAGGPMIEGLILVRTQLLQTLQEEGLERIPVVGRPYDPEVAEAVETRTVEDPDQHHVVLEDLLRGYRLNGRVARASHVVVGEYEGELPLPSPERELITRMTSEFEAQAEARAKAEAEASAPTLQRTSGQSGRIEVVASNESLEELAAAAIDEQKQGDSGRMEVVVDDPGETSLDDELAAAAEAAAAAFLETGPESDARPLEPPPASIPDETEVGAARDAPAPEEEKGGCEEAALQQVEILPDEALRADPGEGGTEHVPDDTDGDDTDSSEQDTEGDEEVSEDTPASQGDPPAHTPLANEGTNDAGQAPGDRADSEAEHAGAATPEPKVQGISVKYRPGPEGLRRAPLFGTPDSFPPPAEDEPETDETDETDEAPEDL